MKTRQIPRRTFLKGAGTALALPGLEAMAPLASTAANPGGDPLRMAFVYAPNGMIMKYWTPEGKGSEYNLPQTLAPLQSVKSEIQVVSGLNHDKAEANGDGGGDHARANATFLTGRQAKKTSGKDIRIGVSVDQLAAQKIGHHTRFKSLELSCDKTRQTGNCDSGYSCAYNHNISWSSERTPVPAEVNPRAVFERLFAGASSREAMEARKRRMTYRKSILDTVMDDARGMQSRLGYTDRQKLDEYLDSVREIEQRIERAEQLDLHIPDVSLKPEGIPKSYKEHMRLMFDLMVLAFQTDTTRISTFMMAHDGSNRSFREIGIGEGHHHLSHHNNRKDWVEKLAKIDHFYVEQYAYFLKKLQSIPEGSGTLLDHCMIVYGSGISDGNRHDHDNLPVILAGQGNGTLQTGRHLKLPGDPPMTNLFLSMLDRMGVEEQRFGDSTGRLEQIS